MNYKSSLKYARNRNVHGLGNTPINLETKKNSENRKIGKLKIENRKLKNRKIINRKFIKL